MNLDMFIEKLAALKSHTSRSPMDHAVGVLAEYFHHFFREVRRIEIGPSTGAIRGYFIDSQLPELINEGIEKLVASHDEYSEKIKYLYSLHLRLPIVSLEQFESTHGHPLKFAWPNLVAAAVRLVEYTAGACAAKRVERYLNAPLYALRHSFDGFLRDVYRGGLCCEIDASATTPREHYGYFGRTTLTTCVVAGEVRITFSHRSSLPYRGIAPERSKLCFGVKNNTRGSDSTFHGCDVDLKHALAMIEDVRTHWPRQASLQRSKIRPYIAPVRNA